MAPEIFKRSEFFLALRLTFTQFLAAGHGKPVDVWAMGVITYFLLAGACGTSRGSVGSSDILTRLYPIRPRHSKTGNGSHHRR